MLIPVSLEIIMTSSSLADFFVSFLRFATGETGTKSFDEPVEPADEPPLLSSSELPVAAFRWDPEAEGRFIITGLSDLPKLPEGLGIIECNMFASRNNEGEGDRVCRRDLFWLVGLDGLGRYRLSISCSTINCVGRDMGRISRSILPWNTGLAFCIPRPPGWRCRGSVSTSTNRPRPTPWLAPSFSTGRSKPKRESNCGGCMVWETIPSPWLTKFFEFNFLIMLSTESSGR